ncbi:hypothetical protein HHI36_004704 [Cryptolaemus montrouzieri]|uniref:Uncharacterized protein n=1 Tax=Cryptolaemus montrouzieri TaxID=559131 RepID=A0ABD2NRY0_9CUCU
MEKVISSEKEPQEESIYDDIICQGDLGLTIHNLKSKNLQLQLHVTSLEEDIQKLCDRITEMKQIQDNLSRNISELYKTAKSEIDRKDRLISELQLKIDDMVFKRNTAPSNFGVKRYREEDRSSEVVGNKKVRCDVKTITDEDQLRDKNEYNNAIHKDVHRDDKKKDADESRNYRSADIQGERSRNSSRNDDRRRDEYSSRSDKTRRRRSISRDRGRRDSRNCRDNQGKDRFEYTRRRRDNDFRDQGIRKDCRGPRSRNERSRNEFEVERNKDHDKNELISRHEILKSEPRFSSAESSRSTPEIIYPKSTLNESKEEGEVSENEAENKKENSSLDKRSKRNDKANKTIENVKYSTNYREDQNKQFDVTKFITRQQDISRKKDVKIKTKEKSLGTIETNDRNESHRKENVSSKKENVAGKKENQKEESILSESTMKDIDERITKAKENENTKSTKSTRIQRKSEIESVTIENTDLNEEDQVISETKNENVTILSQILLTQGKVESIQDTKLKP